MKNKKYKLGKNVPAFTTRVVEDYRNRKINRGHRRGTVIVNNLSKNYSEDMVLVEWDFDNPALQFREEKELQIVSIHDLTEEELFVNASTPEGLALEEEFKQLVETVGKTIKDKVMAAQTLLQEAEQLASDSGLPFYSPISPLDQPYIPYSFGEKFSKVDKIVVQELTKVGHYALEGYTRGWQTSQLGC